MDKVNSINPWLKIISRTSAWLLLAGVAVLIVSGWGITQTSVIYNATFGLVDRRLADAIHRATNIPLTVFFLVHVLTNIKISLSRSRASRQWLINGILIIIGLALLGVMVYMELFRRGG